MRKIFTLLLFLILFPYMTMAQNDTGVFTVAGGELGKDYTYSGPDPSEPGGAGVLTVKTSTGLTISTNSATESPANGRIVIENNVEANITLAGLSIEPAEMNSKPGYSGIDLGSGATLDITLRDNTTNEILGGTSGTGLPAPGIHVPESASLVIQGSGDLSVTGGDSSNDYGGNGIGGNSASGEAGEASGTVIILATGTVNVNGGSSQISGQGGIDIGGGQGSTDGDNGQGIRPGNDGSYTVWGNLELPEGVTFPKDITLNIPKDATLNLPDDFAWSEGIKVTGEGSISDSGKLTATITFVDNVNLDKTYDGEAVSINNTNYTYDGNGEPAVTWHKDNNETIGEQLSAAPSDAGTYWVKVAASETNFYMEAEATKKFTIAKAKATVTDWTTESPYICAEGQAIELKAPAVTGANNEEVKYKTVTVTYQKEESGDATTTAPSEPGKYTAKATYAGNANYEDTEAKVTFEILAAEEIVATIPENTFESESTTGWLRLAEGQSYPVTLTAPTNFTFVSGQTITKDGEHSYTLKRESSSQETTVTHTLYIDSTDPTATLGEPSSTEVVITLADNLSGIATCTVKEEEEVLYSYPETRAATTGEESLTYIYTGEAETTHTLTVTIKDMAGNEATQELTVTFAEEPDTPVIPDMPKYYNIMVEECEGVTVEVSSTVVREGQSMTFTVDVAEGYSAEDMTVKVKRSLFGTTDIIEPNDEGIYEIKNIYTDIYITVAGVEEEETPTGMEDVESAKVYTKDGSLYVETPQRVTVSIVSMTGAVVEQSEQIGLKRYDLPRGIYVICIGEERYKVRY